MSRKIPLYILVDMSERLSAAAMKAVNQGLGNCLESLKKNPVALDSLWVSIIAIGSIVYMLYRLTDDEIAVVEKAVKK